MFVPLPLARTAARRPPARGPHVGALTFIPLLVSRTRCPPCPTGCAWPAKRTRTPRRPRWACGSTPAAAMRRPRPTAPPTSWRQEAICSFRSDSFRPCQRGLSAVRRLAAGPRDSAVVLAAAERAGGLLSVDEREPAAECLGGLTRKIYCPASDFLLVPSPPSSFLGLAHCVQGHQGADVQPAGGGD